MAILFHALAALVLGNFRLASFLKRAHSDLDFEIPIQPLNTRPCNLVLCCDFECFSDDCESTTALYSQNNLPPKDRIVAPIKAPGIRACANNQKRQHLDYRQVG
jgi:hypothetical protein